MYELSVGQCMGHYSLQLAAAQPTDPQISICNKNYQKY